MNRRTERDSGADPPVQRDDLGNAHSEVRYAFDDTHAAADRLAFLAEVFGPSSRALLAEVGGHHVDLAVDLGCGPGFTTHLLASALAPSSLAGIDRSESFLARAHTIGPPGAVWFHHDITVVPLPTGPADVLYARYVLAHLPEPRSVLVSWLGQLRVGGHLLVEEDERIIAEHPVLKHYEELSFTLVDHYGGNLYVGVELARIGAPVGFERSVSRLVDHPVPSPRAARLFAMNFAVWRHDPFILGTTSERSLDAIAQGLERLADPEGTSDVVFCIRQLAFRRTASEKREGAE